MNIKDAENHIDKVWENLRIYRLPLHRALFMILSIFEAQNSALREMLRDGKIGRRELEGGLTHTKDGLQTLIPQILKKCPRARFDEKDIKILRGLRTSVQPAYEASVFAQRYSWFAYHMMSYYQNWMTCSMDGRVLAFSLPESVNVGRSLSHHALQRFHEKLHIDANRGGRTYLQGPYTDTTGGLRSGLRHKNVGEFLCSIPRSVLDHAKAIVDVHSPSPTIQADVVFETYSIGDYYKFWKHLSALMLCYLEACKVRYRGGSGRLLSSRVLIVTADEIADAVAASGELSTQVCSNIVADFKLDPLARRPDTKVRYIVPIEGSDYVFLSPTLVFTASWEVCLFRNWAKISDKRYGAVIASKKDRLADELAKHFDSNKAMTAVRKEIAVCGQEPLGEIDLAVFDKESGYLALVELKWLLPPDSFQEHSHARTELSEGVKQLRRIMNHYERDGDSVLRQAFTGHEIEAGMVTEVQLFLICDGDMSDAGEADDLGITMLDYQLCACTLAMHSSDSVKERFRKATDRNLAYSQGSVQDLCYHTMKIAGYAFRTPGLRMAGKQYVEHHDSSTSFRPQSPCGCGSGRKHRDCCRLVESVDESPIDYVQYHADH